MPSAYHLFCNIHPQMVAFVVIVPTPWITTASPDGTWRLDVPSGRYRVSALSERARITTAEVRTGAPASQTIVLTLDESTFVAGAAHEQVRQAVSGRCLQREVNRSGRRQPSAVTKTVLLG